MAEYTRSWREELRRRRLRAVRDFFIDMAIGLTVVIGGMAVVYLALGLWHH